MAYQVIVNKRFISRLTDVQTYLETEWGKKVADDFLNMVVAKINLLRDHPYIGALTKFKNVRGIFITKHNRMFYRVKGNKITILNLYDTRRKTY